ncbi:MAG TPA: rhodanese-like domain-containing protein [Planctomycetota bacterium]|nr:rhodanese-like domain-containing protein [Planctomycetota bacterium]
MPLRREDPPGPDEVDRWFREVPKITCEELQRRLAAGEAITVLDVRTEGEWSARRIPGARHVPLQEFEDRLDELLAMPGPLAVHCEHGVRSIDATLFLKWQGRDDVLNVVEGLCAWSGPTTSG